jgi:RNA polymerase-binding protein DksA
MSINYSELASTKRTSSTHSSRFQQTEPARIAPSSEDWRPGSGRKTQKPSKPLNAFASAQKERLLQLRTALAQSMEIVASDACPEPGDASAVATHPGDAGTDASDRDLALRLLYLEQNTLVEIDEALRRIEEGTYGICEMSGEPIPIRRLEALPFARLTVECQSQIEKQKPS